MDMLRNSEFNGNLRALSPSPIRGQLEPQDPNNKPGWRYIQCTDTLNELKVLLPPRAAFHYGQLLKSELSVLANRHFIDWNRLVEIRHLKERMLRKCHRLSKAWSSSALSRDKSGRVAFLKVPAPEDFRLKELEKWVHSEEIRLRTQPSRNSLTQDAKATSVCCDRCWRPGCAPHRSSIHSSRRSSTHSSRSQLDHTILKVPHIPQTETSSPISQSTTYNDSNASPEKVEKSLLPGNSMTRIGEVYHKPLPDPMPRETHEVLDSDFDDAVSLVSVPKSDSPEPLPHPYRHRDSMDLARLVVTRATSEFTTAPNTSPSPTTDNDMEDGEAPFVRSATNGKELEDDDRPALVRRRSSLKQPSGLGRLSGGSQKVVAWAMDRDLTEQMAKQNEAAEELELADKEWEEMSREYEEQLAALSMVRQNVSRALIKMRVEAKRLHEEEQAMHDHEEKLRMTYTRLEQKQNHYRAKTKKALDESQLVVSLCTTKRDAGFDAS